MKKSEKGSKKNSKQTYFSNKHLTVITIALFVIALFALSFVDISQPNLTGQATVGEKAAGNFGPNENLNANQQIVFVLGDTYCDVRNGETQYNSQDCRNKEAGAKRNVNEDSFIYNLFAKWSEGNLDQNVAKFLLFFLLFMLIFSVLRFIRLFNGFITALISLIVSFLATAYITPPEVFAVLTVYTGLGLALSIAVPFFIMIAFSIALLTPYSVSGGNLVVDNAQKRKMFQYITVAFLWLLFVGFIIYKAIDGWAMIPGGMLIVMGIIIAIGIVFMIKPSWVARLIARYVWTAEADRLAAVAKARGARRRAQERQTAEAGNDPLAHNPYDRLD